MLTKKDKKHLEQILDYWFGQLTPEQWFIQDTQVDSHIRDHFLEIYHSLQKKDLLNITFTGKEILPTIILFDQMPRNMFRHSPQAFETDPLARSLCYLALANRLDLDMTDLQKTFIYMPLEHSEDMKDQELCISLFQQRTALPQQIDYAIRHFQIIKEFGRFPHRNKILGRLSTAEEEKFLSTGGDSFENSEN